MSPHTNLPISVQVDKLQEQIYLTDVNVMCCQLVSTRQTPYVCTLRTTDIRCMPR